MALNSAEEALAALSANRPCVIIAAPASLCNGPSRALFLRAAASARNAVVFTGAAGAPPGSLAAQLLPSRGGGGGARGAPPAAVTLETVTSVPLSGEELVAWRDEREAEARAEARAAAAARARAAEEAEAAATAAAVAAAAAAAAAEAAAAEAAAATAAARAPAAAAMEVDGAPPPPAAVAYSAPSDRASFAGAALFDDLAVVMAAVPGARGAKIVRQPVFGRDTTRDAHIGQSDYGFVVGASEWGGVGVAAGGDSVGVGVSGGGDAAAAAAGAAAASAAAAAAATTAAAAAAAIPTKRVRNVHSLRLSARIFLHPLEGAAEGEELLHLIEATAPAVLVVMPGGDGGPPPGGRAPLDAARAFAAAAVRFVSGGGPAREGGAVHVLGDAPPPPAGGASVPLAPPLDVSSNVVELSFRLIDVATHAASAGVLHPRVRPVAPSLARLGPTYAVAYVTLQLQPADELGEAAMADGAGGDEGGGTLVLAAPQPEWLPPPGGAGGGARALAAGGGHLPHLLRVGGPLRLPALRAALAEAGVESDIVEGVLVTRRDGVTVRRRAAPQGAAAAAAAGLDVEGPASRECSVVRGVLEQLHVMV